MRVVSRTQKPTMGPPIRVRTAGDNSYRAFADFFVEQPPPIYGKELIAFVDLSANPDGSYYFNVVPNPKKKVEIVTTGAEEAEDRTRETEESLNR